MFTPYDVQVLPSTAREASKNLARLLCIVLSPALYTEQVLRHFQKDKPLRDLLACLVKDLADSIGGCLGLLIFYRPTPEHQVEMGSTLPVHPEMPCVSRSLEQQASLHNHPAELSEETCERLRRILSPQTERAFLYPVRPFPDAPVELFLVALFDHTASEPADVFSESRLYQLLFHLRGAALRQNQRCDEISAVSVQSIEDSQVTTLAEVGAALTSALNLEDLLRLILEISAKLVGAHQGNIGLIEGQEEVQSFSLQRNSSPKNCGHLYIPIARHGRLKALLSLERSGEVLTDRTLKTLYHFTDQAAMAIENAQIFEWEQERAREATALYQAARTIEEAHELEDILSCSTEVFTRLTGLTAVSSCSKIAVNLFLL